MGCLASQGNTVKVAVGQTYKLTMMRGKQQSWCYVSDLFEYKGHYGVFGQSTKHQIHLPWKHGYEDIPDRPLAFAIINAEEVAYNRFYDALFMDYPVYLEEPNLLADRIDRLRLPNPQSLPVWHDFGATVTDLNIKYNLAKLKMLPVQVIDLWQHWQKYSAMPVGYEEAKAKARAGV